MTRTKQEVMTEVNRIICEVLDNDSVQLKYETTANDVKEWDSLNHIQIIVAIEKHFNIRFNFAELQKFKNVGEMCDSISSKLGTKGSEA